MNTRRGNEAAELGIMQHIVNAAEKKHPDDTAKQMQTARQGLFKLFYYLDHPEKLKQPQEPELQHQHNNGR